MVFILNFGGGGLNPTILLFFATLSGFLYIVIGELYFPHTLKFYQRSFIIGLISLFLTYVPNPIVSLTFAVIFQISVTPALISSVIVLRKKFSIAAIFAILLNILGLALTNFVSFYTSILGIVLLSIFGLIWFLDGLYLTSKYILIEFTETKISSTSAMIGFIAIETVFLGYPNVIAVWFQTNLFLVTLVELIALSLSLYLLTYMKRMVKHLELIYISSYTLGLLILIYVEISFLYYIGLLMAQTGAFMLLTIGIRENVTDSIRVLGSKMGGVQFLVLILIFLQIATPFWTGLPEILHPILRNNTKFLTLMIGAILPLSAIMGVYWRD
jgi:hypothetical protein